MTEANINNIKRVLHTIVEQIIHITGSIIIIQCLIRVLNQLLRSNIGFGHY